LPNPRAKKERIVLEGDVPSPANPPAGCHFNTRCPFAFDRCRAEAPRLRPVGDGHTVACHLDM
jgi:oligopeptide/dipeptide ABC transporter ATP-binding protein